jgi:hypothetical protein
LLTRQVRVLYEQSVVPVAEIARLAGVSPRTLYKYVQEGGWRRRYLHDTATAVAKRAAVRKPRACVTAKGAGGRFIRAEDVGKPFERGLKALDAEGEARARALAGRAAELSDQAVVRTGRLREAFSDARIMARMVSVLRDLTAIEAAGRTAARKARQEEAEAARDLHEQRLALARKLSAAVAGWKAAEARQKGQG